MSGQVNISAQMYRNNYVKTGLNSSGQIRSLESAAGVINVPSVYPLSEIPYPWMVPAGTKILIDPATCLSGYGATSRLLEFVSDGVAAWIPVGEQVLYYVYGSYSSPADTVGAQNPAVETVFPMGGARPQIPFQFLYKGIGIRIRGTSFKNDADSAATLFRIRMGSNSATGSATVAQVQTGGAAASEVPFDVTARITTLGAVGTAKFTTPGSGKSNTSATQAANGSGDLGSFFSTNANNFIAFTSVPGNITATAALLDFQISLVP